MSRVVRWLAAIALTLGVAHPAMAQTTVRYVHTDALGSVVAMTDENRVVVERREYEPYGQQLTALEDGPGYTGHVQDAASGLTYMQQRYYDSMLGIFLSVDPVEAFDIPVDNFHRFRYAANNPYSYYDPDGREQKHATGSRVENRWSSASVRVYDYRPDQEGDTGSSSGSSPAANGGSSGSSSSGTTVDMGAGPVNCPSASGCWGYSLPVEPSAELLVAAVSLHPVGRTVSWLSRGVTSRSLLFGQANIRMTFRYGPHAGRSIGEVAALLRSGRISPDSLPIQYIVRNGQAIALNNRSLLALRRAGMEPTITRNMTGNARLERLLDSHLRGGSPANVIRVRGGPPGSSSIE